MWSADCWETLLCVLERIFYLFIRWHLSFIFWCFDKTPWQNQPKREQAYFVLLLKARAHHGREVTTAETWNSYSHYTHNQEADSDECWDCSNPFFSLHSLGSKPGDGATHSGWVFPPQSRQSRWSLKVHKPISQVNPDCVKLADSCHRWLFVKKKITLPPTSHGISKSTQDALLR